MHRIWNKLSQSNLAEDIGTTFQQYQKIERCYNRIFAEQLISICNNRKWDVSIIAKADPKETLDEWINRDYATFKYKNYPDKYHKIMRSWDILDKSAQRNYYGEEPIPFIVDSIERGN